MPEVEEVEYDEQKGLIDILEGLNDDGFPSKTSVEQIRVENIVERCLSKGMNLFHRSSHYYYIFPLSSTLPEYFSGLDASRCWLSYWILHSMDLLGILGQLAPVLTLKFVDFLNRCQNSSGGFGGGPQQLSHLAPTYAAVMSLAILGEDCALKVIDRRSMYAFLLRLKQPDGSFLMHEEGEADLRASYCALAVASLLNILTEELLQNAEDYISKCQTYEGGLGGEPGNEAHGGYTYCGLAALVLIKKTDAINLERLIRWASLRQMSLEGGFQGRTNKLVDGCYSFWVGALFPLIYRILEERNGTFPQSHWIFDSLRLQNYVLNCCQHSRGGLVDKPPKAADLYHTCYCLSGLSIAQNMPQGIVQILGDLSTNRVASIDPLFNISIAKLENAQRYFNDSSPIS